MVSRKLIDEFKQIMKEEYGVELNDMDAHKAATNLVGYFDLLMKLDFERKQKEKQGQLHTKKEQLGSKNK